MAGIFTERIWQPCICQPNELKREIKKKNEGPNGGPSKKLGGHGPFRPPLRIAIDVTCTTVSLPRQMLTTKIFTMHLATVGFRKLWVV